VDAFRFRPKAWLWFLSLTLVLQGMAVATMITCEPAHARMQAEVAMHGDHSHAHHSSNGHDQASSFEVSDQGPVSGADVYDLTCSACASCCMGAALPFQQVRMEMIPVRTEAVSGALSPAADFVVSRPTPPPRTLRA
jgi:hypothetical protein